MTESEAYISHLNSNFFFKEFSFSRNKFNLDEKGEQLELADNVVWLDDLLLISQIKERDKTAKGDSINWFKNKVLGKAVKQIKDTIKYFDIYNDIYIQNERGHILNIGEARKLEPIKLIIYSPGKDLPESTRFLKFHKSKDVGLIHLFHIEDYLWICKYLITPFEIREFLKFRETLFKTHENILNNLPEQYVLGHYIETLDVKTINPKYIENVTKLIQDNEKFDISFIIENFKAKILEDSENLEYYSIIKEIAKLDRSDLREFKKRFEFVIEKAKDQIFTLPTRMTSLKSKCGFVFVVLQYDKRTFWKNAVVNFTEAHKYDQRLDKTMGMIVYHNPTEKYFDINWCFIEFKWVKNQEFENLLKDNFPFRPVGEKMDYRYYVNDLKTHGNNN